MRLLIVALVCAAALPAQAVEPDTSAKLRQFESNLQNAMKLPSAVASLRKQLRAVVRSQVCAIPLLKVGPDPAFHSNMPAIPPDSNVSFAAREIVPPSPVCESRDWK